MSRIVLTALLALTFAVALYAQGPAATDSSAATVTPMPLPNLLPTGAIGRIVADGGVSPVSSGVRKSSATQGVTGPKGGSVSPNANSSEQVGRTLNSNTAPANELIQR